MSCDSNENETDSADNVSDHSGVPLDVCSSAFTPFGVACSWFRAVVACVAAHCCRGSVLTMSGLVGLLPVVHQSVAYLQAEPLLALSIGFTALYFLMIAVVRKSDTFPLKKASAVHYLFLVGLSAVMCLGATWSIVQVAARTGSLRRTVCVPLVSEMDAGMRVWMTIFHVSKYVELIDTALALLKGGTSNFRLQVYHHVVVMYQTWSWLAFDFALGIWGTATNSLVHVVMYFFFYLGSQGVRVMWKNAVTYIQLAQFLFSFLLYGVYLYLHFWGGGCKALAASLLSVSFNVSLFVLFNGVLAFNKKRRTPGLEAEKGKMS